MKQEDKFSTCVVCSEPLDNDSIVYCPHCKKPYHEQCWRKAGYGCKIYKCKGSTLLRWPKIEILIAKLIGQGERLSSECKNQNCANYLKETSPFYRYCIKCGEELNSLDTQKGVFAYPGFEFIARHITIFVISSLLLIFIISFANFANNEMIKQNQSHKIQTQVAFQLTSFKTQIPTNTFRPADTRIPPTSRPADTRISPTQRPADTRIPPTQRPANVAQARISNEIYFASLRQSPGYKKKNQSDLLAEVPAGDIVQILGGPEKTDGLNWWQVSWNGKTGWMADHTTSGKTIMIFLP